VSLSSLSAAFDPFVRLSSLPPHPPISRTCFCDVSLRFEKATALITRAIAQGRQDEIGLVVVDEAQMIGEAGGDSCRGALLETMILKLLHFCAQVSRPVVTSFLLAYSCHSDARHCLLRPPSRPRFPCPNHARPHIRIRVSSRAPLALHTLRSTFANPDSLIFAANFE
jgi:hypothetical protein